MDHDHEQGSRRVQQRPAQEQAAPQTATDAAPIQQPALPAPLPVSAPAQLTVGHAEDRAESEADAHADRALARLAKVTGEAHQHGPGCEHLRRSPTAPAGTAVVGREGGDLDPGTSQAIQSRRGRGQPLSGDLLDRMETAFDTDLSGVRVHTDTSAATLNNAVSARAFTTGQDIFFGSGEYSPDTPGGAKILAHEVAHTLQNSGGLRRSVKEYAATFAGGSVATAVAPVDIGSAAAVPMSDLATLPGTQYGTFDRLADAGPDAIPKLPGTARTLMGILKGAFEMDWFKAKQCLVFADWPGAAAGGQPPVSAANGLRIMKALTVLRGYVHVQVRERLNFSKEEMEFKGSVGADTVTSDVDVSTGGKDTETGVKQYNAAFRDLLDTTFDPGTVFDLNVYAKDFIHGFDSIVEGDVTTLVPRQEVGVASLDAPGTQRRDDAQEAWSLVHMSRFLDAQEWDDFVEKSLATEVDPEGARKKYLQARLSSILFHKQIEIRKEQLKAREPSLATAVGPEGASSWGADDQATYLDGALQMRAANSLYEETLTRVKDLRNRMAREEAALSAARTAAATTPDGQAGVSAQQAKVNSLSLTLLEQVSLASLYANEVYGSGDAVLHAVVGTQIGRKKQDEQRAGYEKDGVRHAPNKNAVVVLGLSPRQWLNAFNDNVGDVLKDFEHLASGHGPGEAMYWWAAFKMGKYTERMLDAFKNLAASGAITAETQIKLCGSDEFIALTTLATHHLRAKKGVAASDPAGLAQDEYFKDYTSQESTAAIKTMALTLAVKVRAAVAESRTEQAAQAGGGGS